MRRVLITGCSTGIGRAMAVELGRRGYAVIATARRVDSITDLDAVLHLPLDVTNDTSVRAAVEAAGRIDVLVNNAGLGCWGPIETVPFEEVRRLFETNVLGVVRMVQAVLPGMRARAEGAIVNISSMAGRGRGGPCLGYYSASKHALEVISQALRLEVGHLGIRVVLIEPGAIESNFPQNRIVGKMDEPPYQEIGRLFNERIRRSRATAYPSSHVAEIVAKALEAERPPLRWLGSPDAEEMARRSEDLSDEEYEARMRASLGLSA